MTTQLTFLNRIARNTDPSSSHEAARNLATRECHAALILEALRQDGGALTSHEIAVALDALDAVKITKRLNDLRHNHLVKNGDIRRCRVTRRNLQTWFAANEHA